MEKILETLVTFSQMLRWTELLTVQTNLYKLKWIQYKHIIFKDYKTDRHSLNPDAMRTKKDVISE